MSGIVVQRNGRTIRDACKEPACSGCRPPRRRHVSDAEVEAGAEDILGAREHLMCFVIIAQRQLGN